MKKWFVFCLLFLAAAFSEVAAQDFNLLPDSEDDFLCCRASVEKCDDGYTGLMSSNRWAELIWVPPEIAFSSLELDIQAINPLDGQGQWAVKIVDAEGEIFNHSDKKRVNVKSTVANRKLVYNVSDFIRDSGSKGDEAMTFPLKRIYLLYIHRPALPGKAVGFVLKSCKGIR